MISLLMYWIRRLGSERLRAMATNYTRIQTLVFQHGERLFIRRDGEYVVLPVRLAHRSYVLDKIDIKETYKMSRSDCLWYKANFYLQVVVL